MNKQNLPILKYWVCSWLTKRQNIYCWLVYHCCRQSTSSVARVGGRGARSPSIGLKSMQNSTFLVLLRPIFAPKMKTAPPKGIWEPKLWRTCRCLDQNSGFFWFWSSPKVGEDLFFYGDHPISARKKPFEFRWRPFFFVGDHLHLAGKNPWISDFGREKPFEFRWRPFFFEITCIIRPEKNPWISYFDRKKNF